MDLIADPVVFFHDLGGLHDARVDWLGWDDGEVRLVVRNLNANFMDGDKPNPHYPGYTARPATVVFSGVCNISGHMRHSADYISSLDIVRLRDCYRVAIVGTDTWMFAFECDQVALDQAGEPASVSAHYANLKA